MEILTNPKYSNFSTLRLCRVQGSSQYFLISSMHLWFFSVWPLWLRRVATPLMTDEPRISTHVEIEGIRSPSTSKGKEQDLG